MYIWDFTSNIKFTKNKDNRYHSFNDLPALEYINDPTSVKIWMNNGYVHRDNNLPAYTKMIDYLGFPEKVEYREYYNMGNYIRRAIAYYDETQKIIMEVAI
jgi:hypothetical protein